MSDDTATATDEVTHIADNKEAAAACDLSIKQFAALKKEPGFPQKEPDGWPILRILDWLVARQQEDDDEGTEDLTGQGDSAANSSANSSAVQWVQIMVPVCTPSEPRIATQQFRPNMFRGRVDTRVTDEKQLLGLRNSHAGCRNAHVQFPNESHVDRVSDLIKWLCHQIGEEIEAGRFVAAPTVNQA